MRSTKALILAITGPFMLFFAVAGASTIEYNLDNNLPIPWQVYALFACVVVWMVLVLSSKNEEFGDVQYNNDDHERPN